MIVSVISTCSEKLSEREFVDPIVNIVENYSVTNTVNYFHYTNLDQSSILDSDRIIICGTSLQDKDYLDKLEIFQFILSSKIPTLGICSGFQIISLLGGCIVVDNREIGMIDVSTLSDNRLCNGNFQAFSLHNFSVSENSKLKILASSTQAPQIIKIVNLSMYGVSFHPEVRNEAIISNFLD